MATPKCYDCKWRCERFDTAHSRCVHPDARGTATAGVQAMSIKANPHGAESGWFNWPSRFDPVWLENCDGFEAAEEPPNDEENRNG